MSEQPLSEVEESLVLAAVLDGKGGARDVGWEEIRAGETGGGVLWLHLSLGHPDSDTWLDHESGLNPASIEALRAEGTRPRSFRDGDGLVVILRGVNPTPGSEPDDMVAVRTWVEAERIITLRARRTAVPQQIYRALGEGEGPRNAADFLVSLAQGLVGRVTDALIALDDAVDELENETVVRGGADLRARTATLRRNAIGMRRHLAPQREAMKQLMGERVSWFNEVDRVHMREVADRVTRAVEDLDAARDRAAITQEELTTRLSEQMNRTMYMLSIVTAVFLPLGLLTGLLGINVGGMPGVEDPRAFWVVCGLLVALAGGVIWVVRWKRLI